MYLPPPIHQAVYGPSQDGGERDGLPQRKRRGRLTKGNSNVVLAFE